MACDPPSSLSHSVPSCSAAPAPHGETQHFHSNKTNQSQKATHTKQPKTDINYIRTTTHAISPALAAADVCFLLPLLMSLRAQQWLQPAPQQRKRGVRNTEKEKRGKLSTSNVVEEPGRRICGGRGDWRRKGGTAIGQNSSF